MLGGVHAGCEADPRARGLTFGRCFTRTQGAGLAPIPHASIPLMQRVGQSPPHLGYHQPAGPLAQLAEQRTFNPLRRFARCARNLGLSGVYLLVLGGGPSAVDRCVRHRAQFGLLCCAPCAGDDACGGFGGFPGEFGQDVRVGVRGDGDGGMTEQVLDDLEVGAGGEGQGGGAVAQVVQSDGWESSVSD